MSESVSFGSVCEMFTCLLHVGGGVGISHRIHIHKLLLEDGQQEGEAVVQSDVQDELKRSRGSDHRASTGSHHIIWCFSYL